MFKSILNRIGWSVFSRKGTTEVIQLSTAMPIRSFEAPGPLTKTQIEQFDRLYERVPNVNTDGSMKRIHGRPSIRRIMENKIKNRQQLEFFVKHRGSNMQIPQLAFCIELYDKMQQEPPRILQEILLKQLKIPKNYANTLLKFAINQKIPDFDCLTRITKTYLEQQVDIELLLRLPTNILQAFRKTIIKQSKNTISSAVAVFYRLAQTKQQIRQFDQYFTQQANFMSKSEKIQALQKFAQSNQKGIFVQYLKQTLKSQHQLKYILQTLIALTQLHQITQDYFQLFQIKIMQNIKSKQQLNMVIQIAHHNYVGSKYFWQAINWQAVRNDYSQLFAILGGLQRNFTTDFKIFQTLLSLDGQMQAMDLQQNEFLKLMLVYWANMRAIENSDLRDIIYRRVKDKLLEIYKNKKYKIFAMLFLWLLEQQPVKKKEYRKLLYASEAEEGLLRVMEHGMGKRQLDEEQTILSEAEDILMDKYDYWEVNPERSALEEYIRRLKFKFQGTKL